MSTKLLPSTAVALLALLLCSCGSSKPVRVDATARVSDRVTSGRHLADTCGFAIGTISDLRPGNASTVAGRAVILDDVEDRIRAVLAARGIAEAGTNPLDIELMSAYGYSKDASMTFTTVLRAHPKGEALVARGTHTTMKWSGGRLQIAPGLLKSVDTAANRLADLLAEACR